jgi:tetratricopeptide (TPR) repeat protein
MSFVRSLGLAGVLLLPAACTPAQKQDAALERLVADTYPDDMARAGELVALANKYEVPVTFDSSLPEGEMIRQREQAIRKKYGLYEEAIRAYSGAIAARETADAVQGRALAYWQRAMRVLSPEDVPLAQRDFERVLQLAPERTEVHAIIGGIHVWNARFAQTAKSREDEYVAAYQSFFQARSNHAKHQISDAKLLQYVDEQLRELNGKIPEARKYQ